MVLYANKYSSHEVFTNIYFLRKYILLKKINVFHITMALINEKLGEFSLMEAFGTGLAKSLMEQLQTPLIGNGTYFSGAVKIGEAWAVGKFLGKNTIGKTVANALVIDGVEDIINALFSGGSSVDKTQSSRYI